MYVNGKEIILASPKDLQTFLVDLGYDPMLVAVEHNGSVIPRRVFEKTQLFESDQLEVVCFVGGG